MGERLTGSAEVRRFWTPNHCCLVAMGRATGRLAQGNLAPSKLAATWEGSVLGAYGFSFSTRRFKKRERNENKALTALESAWY